MDLSGGLETAAALSQSSSDSSDVLTPCAEARLAVSSAREEEDVVFQLNDSEELDMLSIDVGILATEAALLPKAHRSEGRSENCSSGENVFRGKGPSLSRASEGCPP
ncbi:hypothetical protein Q8A67_021813 [Cirrhinus molitorella]|uniref:Uncharacterized protein n=1 Tax=Cirrhinus molitorella TaxID=172907 RepID=A0AA88TDE3_9TELE|nr:hypothetical protein Q8A67_021813 [Cirrhinus molitorella]